MKTRIGYWKHQKAFGNIIRTYILYRSKKHKVIYWKQCIWKYKNDNENDAH